MRTKILNSIFILVALILVSCDAETRMPDVIKVSFPKITLDETSDQLIQGGELNGVINVGFYYENDKPVDSRIVVAMNGNYTNTKVFVESLTSFPSKQTISDEQLRQLFSISSIEAGDYFEIGLDVKMDNGVWYPAFNPYGISYGSGPMNLPGSSPIARFRAVCALDIDDFVGPVTINDPFWYEGVYTTTVEKVDDTHIKIKNFADFAGDVIITINPINHSVVVDKQVYDVNLSMWHPSYAIYTNPAVAGKGDLNSCTKKITLTLTYTVDQDSFGSGSLTLSF